MVTTYRQQVNQSCVFKKPGATKAVTLLNIEIFQAFNLVTSLGLHLSIYKMQTLLSNLNAYCYSVKYHRQSE